MSNENDNLFLSGSYFEDEMKTSYLNYAYSVITSRAIPDVRDGLKPVHRRILYSMSELSVWHDKATRKSARIVGDVLGKYHPHGDSSVYMAAVKMAQEFSIRYPLIIGQGNFGSIDDDPPAAMRYTEMKLSRVAEYILEDMNKNTVDFVANFDETLKEPRLLPGKFPNLLCNGTSGIAVGFATDIPPHNFNEISAGISAYIDNPSITVRELMQYIKGPDFPTAGILTSQESIYSVYETGHGSIEVAGKINLEEKINHYALVITEIPYKVVKSKLVEEITNIMLDNKNKYNLILRGIKEVRDESSKEGIRIVIELYKDANVEAIKTALYKETALSTKIKVNMVVLVNNQPRIMSIKDMLVYYVEHRRDVIIKRTQFDLDAALKRIHIVEGLLIALDAIDEVIKTIRSSKDTATARTGLMSNFQLSEIQANAILDMKLQKLTSLEINKLKEEKENLEKIIKDLKEILANAEKRDNIIKTELKEMGEKIGDDRRSKFEEIVTENISHEELINNDPVFITVSKKGYIIREIDNSLKTSSRGSRGRKGDVTDADKLESDDYIFATVSGYIKDTILFVADSGRVYSIKGYEIRGHIDGKITRAHLQNIDRLKEIFNRNERISAVLMVSEFVENNFILFITNRGRLAKISVSLFSSIMRTGINGVKLKEGDAVASAVITDGNQKLFVVKKNAKGFQFSESLFPVHNRGVSGEKATAVGSVLEEVLGMDISQEGQYVIFVTKDGKGKKVMPFEFKELINRGGKGSKLFEIGKNRSLAGFAVCQNEDFVVITTKSGRRISFSVNSIESNLVKLIDLLPNDEVSSIATVKTN